MINYVTIKNARAITETTWNATLNGKPTTACTSAKLAIFPFYKEGKPISLKTACWGLSLKEALSMRFRWNEENKTREDFLKNLCNTQDVVKKIAQVELIHSKKVFALDDTLCSPSQNLINIAPFNAQGDGIITMSKNVIPLVTVADCMPIYLYDPQTCVFGTLHSGWKGTGIIKDALCLAKKTYNANPKDFCVALGPHIRDCCYFVDEERAKYFTKNFGNDCVHLVEKENKNFYALSLEKANLYILKNLGVQEENIVVSKDCTCCNNVFGSFRREAASLNVNQEEKARNFTVQVAWTICNTNY